jgi:hypothetical protein
MWRGSRSSLKLWRARFARRRLAEKWGAERRGEMGTTNGTEDTNGERGGAGVPEIGESEETGSGVRGAGGRGRGRLEGAAVSADLEDVFGHAPGVTQEVDFATGFLMPVDGDFDDRGTIIEKMHEEINVEGEA